MFTLAYFEGGRLLSAAKAPSPNPPVFRSETFDTREAAIERAGHLINAPGISSLALHKPIGDVVLDPHQLAAELGVHLSRND